MFPAHDVPYASLMNLVLLFSLYLEIMEIKARMQRKSVQAYSGAIV